MNLSLLARPAETQLDRDIIWCLARKGLDLMNSLGIVSG